MNMTASVLKLICWNEYSTRQLSCLLRILWKLSSYRSLRSPENACLGILKRRVSSPKARLDRLRGTCNFTDARHLASLLTRMLLPRRMMNNYTSKKRIIDPPTKMNRAGFQGVKVISSRAIALAQLAMKGTS